MSFLPEQGLPAFEDLPAYCRSQIAQGGFSIPWPDYLQPEDRTFKPLYPANGGREFYNWAKIQALQAADQKTCEIPKVTTFALLTLRSEISGYRSWLHQLETGETPACVGDGYRAWLSYLRASRWSAS